MLKFLLQKTFTLWSGSFLCKAQSSGVLTVVLVLWAPLWAWPGCPGAVPAVGQLCQGLGCTQAVLGPHCPHSQMLPMVTVTPRVSPNTGERQRTEELSFVYRVTWIITFSRLTPFIYPLHFNTGILSPKCVSVAFFAEEFYAFPSGDILTNRIEFLYQIQMKGDKFYHLIKYFSQRDNNWSNLYI